jgi:hypothetical protein
MRQAPFYALLALAPLFLGCSTGRLKIVSSPPGAQVFIDGRPAGTTPLSLRLKKETHRIRLEKEGFLPVEDHISPIHRNPMLLPLVMILWSGTELDDGKYTFKNCYAFELRAIGGKTPEANPPGPNR